MITPILLCDYYKTIHKSYYPEGLTKVWAYFTPRQSRISNIKSVVSFGIQGMIQEYIINTFNKEFFSRPWEEVDREISHFLENTLDESYDTNAFKDLWVLGYLPIEIRLLVPEGEQCPIGCPLLEITNTHNDFVWVVNFLETLMSTCLWHPITSATIAYKYREIADRYSRDEGLKSHKIPYLMGDFSMRGQTSIEASKRSSAAFLTSFYKTSCIPSIDYLEKYYNTSCKEEIVGLGGISTEHSIMCLLGQNEPKAIQKILDNTDDHETISIVSDTWDYWNMVTNIYPTFLETLEKRNITVNIRPDSGDPVKIIAGYKNIIEVNQSSAEIFSIDLEEYDEDLFGYRIHGDILSYNKKYSSFDSLSDSDNCIKTSDNKYFKIVDVEYFYESLDSVVLQEIAEEEALGSVETLFNIIGGKINPHGFKLLPDQFKFIYGDSITPQRAEDIYKQLHKKKFSIENVTLCAGSYSLQYVTRDTFGFAQKITAAIIDDKFVPVFKDPKTSDSTKKKSHKGLIKVDHDGLNYTWEDNNFIDFNASKTIFRDGVLLNSTSLKEIRDNINSRINNLGKSF